MSVLLHKFQELKPIGSMKRILVKLIIIITLKGFTRMSDRTKEVIKLVFQFVASLLGVLLGINI